MAGARNQAHVYRALYAHLTKPKTKVVEMERWGVLDGEYLAYWARDEADAIAWATPKCGKYTVIHLTGKAKVPA